MNNLTNKLRRTGSWIRGCQWLIGLVEPTTASLQFEYAGGRLTSNKYSWGTLFSSLKRAQVHINALAQHHLTFTQTIDDRNVGIGH
jgi:hypothetical protein